MALDKPTLNNRIDATINQNDRKAITGKTLNGVLRDIVESCFNSVSANMAHDNLELDDNRQQDMNSFAFKMINGKQFVFTTTVAPPTGESAFVFQGYGSGLGTVFQVKNGGGTDAFSVLGNTNATFAGDVGFGDDPMAGYRVRAEGAAGSGAIYAEGYTHFRNQYAHPAGEASFKFAGFGVTGGEKILEILDGSGNQLFRIMGNGLVAANNIIQSDTFQIGTNGIASAFFPNCKITLTSGIEYISRGEIGVGYLSHRFTTDNSVTAAGARIFEFDNYGTVLFGMDKDGKLYANNLPDDPTGLPAKYLFTSDNGDGSSTIKIVN